MSLLTDLPHIATLHVEEDFIDSRGNAAKRPSETGIEVRCRITPLSAGTVSRDSDVGAPGDMDLYRATFPATTPITRWSKIVWEGRTLTIRGGPDHRNQSEATSRVTAVLQRQT